MGNDGLLDHVNSATMTKGRYYARAGRVHALQINGSEITAQVQGSEEEPYHVVIDRQKNKWECSCPVAGICKHVVATLLVATQKMEKVTNHNVPGKSQTIQIHELSTQLQKWVQGLNEADKPAVQKQPRTVAYLIKQASTGHIIELYYVQMNKKGDGYLKNQRMLIRKNSYIALDDMDIEDWEIMCKLSRGRHVYEYSLDIPDIGSILEEVIKTRRCHYGVLDSPPLQLGGSREGEFVWEIEREGCQRLVCQSEGQVLRLITESSPFYYCNISTHQVGQITFSLPEKMVSKLLYAPKVAPTEIKMLESVLPKHLLLPKPKDVKMETWTNIVPVPELTLSLHKPSGYGFYEQEIRAELMFNYKEQRCPFNTSQSSKQQVHVASIEGSVVKIIRSQHKEDVAIKLLCSLGWQIAKNGLRFPTNFEPIDSQILYITVKILPVLRKAGWTVLFDKNFPQIQLHEAKEWYGETSDQGQDWFDFEMGVVSNGKRVNLVPALVRIANDFLESKRDLNELEDIDNIYIQTDELERVVIPGKRLKEIIEIFMDFSYGKNSSEPRLKLNRWQSVRMAELEKAMATTSMRWLGSSELQEKGRALKDVKAIPAIELPQGLRCDLRPYQKEGLNWLQFLRTYQLAGILADDMGLGKTVQALAHILKEKEDGRMQDPCLIIAPTSLMGNWLNEAAKFAPSLRCLVSQGQHRKKYFSQFRDYDVIITTYPLIARDKSAWEQQTFHLLILDEAQNIKNVKTLAHVMIQQIQAKHRLCLTGTPMENHLGELWSLFHFLMPGYLGDEKMFAKYFRKPIEKEGHQQRNRLLINRVNPFILRRSKELVAKELPLKTEIVCPIELTTSQHNLYEAMRLTMYEKVKKEIAQKGLERSYIVILEGLLRLRQICCDPRLIKKEEYHEEDAAKLMYLLEIMPPMIEEGRKILIFSQFTSMIDLIIDALEKRHIAYSCLTGDTKDRTGAVAKFQDGHVPVMLISLKAGGVGLNLTTADTVIHFDPWWNPAVEDQATDRAHRIGQKKPVFVYKFLIAGSVEEKIAAMQQKKKQLISGLLDGKTTDKLDFSMEDLTNLFASLEE